MTTYKIGYGPKENIYGFQQGVDLLDFSALGVEDVSQLLPFFTYFRGTSINLKWNGQITGVFVEKVGLVASDFIFNSSKADLLVAGTPHQDVLFGGGGDDTFKGGGSNSGGEDWLSGGHGDDTYYVRRKDEMVAEAEGGGHDTVIVSTVGYNSKAGQEIERIRTADLAGTGQMRLVGNEFAQEIIGNAGENILDGGTGADILRGFSGNDTYYLRDDGATIFEATGGGTDTVIVFLDEFHLAHDLEIEILRPYDNYPSVIDVTLFGNAFSQTIYGTSGDDVLHDGGRGAADLFRGGDGSDTYRVFNSGDIIEEHGFGTDKVLAAVSYVLGSSANIEALQTNGVSGTAAINLTGNEIAQTIIGNNGVNRLEGKGGFDTLRGYAGADTFVFATTLGIGNGNIDTIVDFNPVDDRFLMSDAVFKALTPGTLKAAQFRANTTGLAQDASDLIIYDNDDGKLFYDPDGVGGIEGLQFAKVAVGLAITNADFSIA